MFGILAEVVGWGAEKHAEVNASEADGHGIVKLWLTLRISDWVPDRMATVCAEAGRLSVEGREVG